MTKIPSDTVRIAQELQVLFPTMEKELLLFRWIMNLYRLPV